MQFSAANNSFQNISNELQFPASLESEAFFDESCLSINDDSGNTRTQFIAKSDNCSGVIAFSASLASANGTMDVYLNGSEIISGTVQPSINKRAFISYPFNLQKDDYLTLSPGEGATGLRNNADTAQLAIYTITDSPALVTPARSNVTKMASFTPGFQGLGAPTSVDCRYKQIDDSYLIQCELAAGTPTAVEIQIGLPNGHTVSSTHYPAVKHVGVIAQSLASTSQYNILATGGDTYLNVGLTGGVGNGLVPQLGTAAWNAGQEMSFSVVVAVEELQDSGVEFLAAIPVEKVIQILPAASGLDTIGSTTAYKTRNINSISGDTEIASIQGGNSLRLQRGSYVYNILVASVGDCDSFSVGVYDGTTLLFDKVVGFNGGAGEDVSMTVPVYFELTEQKDIEVQTKASNGSCTSERFGPSLLRKLPK